MTPLVAAAVALALVPPPPTVPAPTVDLPPIADVIARCESGGNPTAKNPVSTASGLYQFLDGTWEWVTGLPAPSNAYPPHVQDQAFIDLYDDGRGLHHWNASKACWKDAA